MSEWKVEVVRLGPVTALPNSDNLEITSVHGGYPCIVRKGDFREGDLAVYCPIDSIVPVAQPWFAFLADSKGNATARIKAAKRRGTFSMGLLIPVPFLAVVGEDVAERLGVTKWEPDASNVKVPAGTRQKAHDPVNEKMPSWWRPYTDLESVRKWGDVLEPGELVRVEEKLHGSNMTACFTQGRLWVSSHYKMKKRPRPPTRRELLANKVKLALCRVATVLGIPFETPRIASGIPSTEWWRAAIDGGLEEKLHRAPDVIFYGECIGVQDLKYGVTAPTFRAFDAFSLKEQRFLDHAEFSFLAVELDLPLAPDLFVGQWSPDLLELAEGPSTMDLSHVREGIVIRPLKERSHRGLGRVALKYVGQGYLLRHEGRKK